ncbi:MAG: hypothetical protein ABIY70_10550 [Capsulimonas sp.]|uniref:hypothetical protein n=1 Tax=Capsulimonas sp. TaxID=2494211 RepID=UPI0032671A01
MPPKPSDNPFPKAVTVALASAVGLLLADVLPRMMGGGKPILWGRELMGSLAGGVIIACVYAIARQVSIDLAARARRGEDDK